MAIDWKSVREEFETTKLSFTELAGKYGRHPTTVRRRAKKEGWGRRAETAGDKNPEQVLNAHRRLLRGLRDEVERELGEKEHNLTTDPKGVDALLKIFKSERQAWGIGEIGLEVRPDETSLVIKEMDESTVPPGTGTTLERG